MTKLRFVRLAQWLLVTFVLLGCSIFTAPTPSVPVPPHVPEVTEMSPSGDALLSYIGDNTDSSDDFYGLVFDTFSATIVPPNTQMVVFVQQGHYFAEQLGYDLQAVSDLAAISIDNPANNVVYERLDSAEQLVNKFIVLDPVFRKNIPDNLVLGDIRSGAWTTRVENVQGVHSVSFVFTTVVNTDDDMDAFTRTRLVATALAQVLLSSAPEFNAAPEAFVANSIGIWVAMASEQLSYADAKAKAQSASIDVLGSAYTPLIISATEYDLLLSKYPFRMLPDV